jgi:hypothetical protein
MDSKFGWLRGLQRHEFTRNAFWAIARSIAPTSVVTEVPLMHLHETISLVPLSFR